MYVSWSPDSGHATDAQFSVYSGSTAGTLLVQSDLDQTAAPDQDADVPDLGDARFQRLDSFGLHESDPTTIAVQLANDRAAASRTLAADAVYVVRTVPISRAVYDFAGRLVATLDGAGNRTDFVYNGLGRQTETVLPDPAPDGDGPLTRPRTQHVYDATGRGDDHHRRQRQRWDQPPGFSPSRKT